MSKISQFALLSLLATAGANAALAQAPGPNGAPPGGAPPNGAPPGGMPPGGRPGGMPPGGMRMPTHVPDNSDPAKVPSGTYQLDPQHGKITWSVVHFGLSTYIGQFTGVSATLTLDSVKPSNSSLDVTVDTTTLGTFNSALDTHLKSADFLNVASFPSAHYVSTEVTRTGPKTATIDGDLTLHGVTKPVAIRVTFNGSGQAFGSLKAGFTGVADFKRSAFGMTADIPSVSDDVKLMIEGEFAKK